LGTFSQLNDRKTTQWKRQPLWAYQRRTLAADSKSLRVDHTR
jgi:hypothetical protein